MSPFDGVFCRISVNDTEVLNRCSFADPRMKSLLPLSSREQEQLYSRVTDSMVAVLAAEEPETDEMQLAETTEPSQPSLLSNLLPQFHATHSIQQTSRAKVEAEIERFKSLPSCKIDADPLNW